MGSGSNPCCAIRTETSIAALIAEAYSSSITAAQIETANFQISSYTECLTAMGAIAFAVPVVALLVPVWQGNRMQGPCRVAG